MIFSLVHYFFLFISTVINCVSICYSIQRPWLKCNLLLDLGSYRILFPVEVDLFHSYSTIHKSEIMKNHMETLAIESQYQLLNHDYMYSDIQSDIDMSIKDAIDQLEGSIYLLSHLIFTSLIIILIIMATCSILCLFQICCFNNKINHKYLSSVIFTLLFEAGIIFVFVCFTIQRINGGEYLSGFWILTYSLMLNIALILILLLIQDYYNKYYDFNTRYVNIPLQMDRQSEKNMEIVPISFSLETYGSL